MYAVVAPGLKGIYKTFGPVEDIIALYPYTKFRKCKDDKEGWEFINRYVNNHKFSKITTYGSTFKSLYVRMEYFIKEDKIYYNFNTKKAGFIKIEAKGCIINNRRDNIKIEMPNIFLDNTMITGHLIAIYHGIKLLGSFIDVDIIVPDYSIFYALKSYTGSNRIIQKTRKELADRLGEFSVTIR